jgi:hypothetical protein
MAHRMPHEPGRASRYPATSSGCLPLVVLGLASIHRCQALHDEPNDGFEKIEVMSGVSGRPDKYRFGQMRLEGPAGHAVEAAAELLV